jgi:hypothetical protein
MSPIVRNGIVIGLLWFIATTAMAQRAILSDAPSPRQDYELNLEMRPEAVVRSIQMLLSDQGSAPPPMTGFLPGFDVRLDTRQYVGQNVRIFLRLPTAIPGVENIGGIALTWDASGQWLAGSVSPGQEALLYEGTINEAVTGGVLNLVLTISAGSANDFFSIEPIYEVEVIS